MVERADLEHWQRLVDEELGAAAAPGAESPDGIARRRLYTRADLEALPDVDGIPGAYPFLRGAYASMYSGRPWTLRQYAGFSTAR